MTILVAELAAMHHGSVKKAKKMIDVAVLSGFDIVKFQKRTLPDAIPIEERNKIRETTWGPLSYLAYREKLEFSLEQYFELYHYCIEKKIGFSLSCWDLNSLDLIVNRFECDLIKIPSALITNKELMISAAISCNKNNTKFVFSNGMSTFDEIDDAMMWAKQNIKDHSLIYCLICTSEYPCQPKNVNLQQLNTLRKYFKINKWGFSNHCKKYDIAASTVLLDIDMIEVHCCMSRDDDGSDAPFSLEPQQMIEFGNSVRRIEEAKGNGVIELIGNEQIARQKLRKNANTKINSTGISR